MTKTSLSQVDHVIAISYVEVTVKREYHADESVRKSIHSL